MALAGLAAVKDQVAWLLFRSGRGSLFWNATSAIENVDVDHIPRILAPVLVELADSR